MLVLRPFCSRDFTPGGFNRRLVIVDNREARMRLEGKTQEIAFKCNGVDTTFVPFAQIDVLRCNQIVDGSNLLLTLGELNLRAAEGTPDYITHCPTSMHGSNLGFVFVTWEGFAN